MSDLLLVTRVESPFQLELLTALRELGLDARVLFSTGDTGTRPRHWHVDLPDWAVSADVEHEPWRLPRIMDQLRPRVVIQGGYRGWPVHLGRALARRDGRKFGFWLEKTLPGPTWRRALKELAIRQALVGADFVFCIGAGAMEEYQPLLDDRGRLHCLPYAQDLSANLAWQRTPRAPDAPVTFLFSGKFLHRNNVWELLSACRSVRERHGERMRLLLSGYAGMDRDVRSALASDPVLAPAVTHDVDFERWEDRLRPFKRADVLLIPGLHAGWGLIVPEAMSLGLPVIASAGVESARSLVREGTDGFLVEPVYFRIEDAMEHFMQHPAAIDVMGRSARERARSCDTRTVARHLQSVVRSYLE